MPDFSDCRPVMVQPTRRQSLHRADCARVLRELHSDVIEDSRASCGFKVTLALSDLARQQRWNWSPWTGRGEAGCPSEHSGGHLGPRACLAPGPGTTPVSRCRQRSAMATNTPSTRSNSSTLPDHLCNCLSRSNNSARNCSRCHPVIHAPS